MKTLKYTLIALALAFALAGCTGGSGTANFDQTEILYPNSSDFSEQGGY